MTTPPQSTEPGVGPDVAPAVPDMAGASNDPSASNAASAPPEGEAPAGSASAPDAVVASVVRGGSPSAPADARGLLAQEHRGDCPRCNGDCGSANPPVADCPMRPTEPKGVGPGTAGDDFAFLRAIAMCAAERGPIQISRATAKDMVTAIDRLIKAVQP